MNQNPRVVVITILLSTVFFSLPNSAISFQTKVPLRLPFQQHRNSVFVHLRHCAQKEAKVHKYAQSDQDDVIESLDVVLERARKRKPSWVLKGVALFNSPLWDNISWLTKLDLIFVALAFVVNSNGFGVGYVVGKWMTSPQNQTRFRNLDYGFLKAWQQGLLLQYWPVLLAIVLDQVFSDIF